MSEQDLFGNEIKNVTPTKETALQISPNDDLVRMAISKDLDTDKLEKIIALVNQQQDRQKKEDFERNFALMRQKLPAIAKKSGAKDRDGKVLYKYAEIDEIQRLCDPVIFEHGFSYSWREEPIETGKRIWIDITGYGYTKSNFFDCPQIQATGIQNAIQVAGAMSSYGRRYTFVSGFGIIVEGEDSDGQISSDPDVLKLKLESMLQEKGADGKLKLPTSAETVMRIELNKENPDVDKLRQYIKHAIARYGCTPK